jgi:hypothetical protein
MPVLLYGPHPTPNSHVYRRSVRTIIVFVPYFIYGEERLQNLKINTKYGFDSSYAVETYVSGFPTMTMSLSMMR